MPEYGNTMPIYEVMYYRDGSHLVLEKSPLPIIPRWWKPSGSSETQEAPHKPGDSGSKKTLMTTPRASLHQEQVLLHSPRNSDPDAFEIVASPNHQHPPENSTQRRQQSVGLNSPRPTQQLGFEEERSNKDRSNLHTPTNSAGDVTNRAQPPTPSCDRNSWDCSNDPRDSPQAETLLQTTDPPPPYSEFLHPQTNSGILHP